MKDYLVQFAFKHVRKNSNFGKGYTWEVMVQGVNDKLEAAYKGKLEIERQLRREQNRAPRYKVFDINHVYVKQIKELI